MTTGMVIGLSLGVAGIVGAILVFRKSVRLSRQIERDRLGK